MEAHKWHAFIVYIFLSGVKIVIAQWVIFTYANDVAAKNIIAWSSSFYIPKTPHPLAYTMKCACCGAEMLPDKELEKTIIYKCEECGLSDSRMKDIG